MNEELMSSMMNKDYLLTNDFLPMTEDQREHLILVISQWAKHIKAATKKHPTFVDIKYSGLLRRLLDGDVPYKFSVPRNNMQPWYEVMTGERVQCNAPNVMHGGDSGTLQVQVMLGQYDVINDNAGADYVVKWPGSPYTFRIFKDEAENQWYIQRTDTEE